MHDIRSRGAKTPADGKERREIARVRKSVDRQAAEAERKMRRERGQRALRARAAGERIRDDAHLMPARGLLACEVEHMAKEAADRRSQHVDNPQGARAVESAPRKSGNRFLARSALLCKIDYVLRI